MSKRGYQQKIEGFFKPIIKKSKEGITSWCEVSQPDTTSTPDICAKNTCQASFPESTDNIEFKSSTKNVYQSFQSSIFLQPQEVSKRNVQNLEREVGVGSGDEQ
jgi:hypothetical protein